MSKNHKGPKVLLIDIETAPIKALVWGLWENNVSLDMIDKDWHLLSCSAKWLHEPAEKIMYFDQSKAKNIENDKPLLKKVWKLLDEADIIIAQNGKRFDHKKLNARFVIQGMKPPTPYKIIDTLLISKKHFGFTSNKLAYLTDKLCVQYKKLKHKKFPGIELWIECMAGSKEAWKEMKKYNTHDVLAMEEVYYILMPWDNSINFSVYTDDLEPLCSCGHTKFKKNGFHYTDTGKYQIYECKKCGHHSKGRTNLLSHKTTKNLRRGVPRS